jgi:hypothetical protein
MISAKTIKPIAIAVLAIAVLAFAVWMNVLQYRLYTKPPATLPAANFPETVVLAKDFYITNANSCPRMVGSEIVSNQFRGTYKGKDYPVAVSNPTRTIYGDPSRNQIIQAKELLLSSEGPTSIKSTGGVIIQDIPTPMMADQAANKAYVDGAVSQAVAIALATHTAGERKSRP